MATMTTTSSSTAKHIQPSRTFSIRRSFYEIAKIPERPRPKTAGGKKSSGNDDEAHRNRLKRRISTPVQPELSFSASTSLGAPLSEARTEPGWRVSMAPPDRLPPPVPDLQVPKSAPPEVTTFGEPARATNPRLFGDDKGSSDDVEEGKSNHPPVNVKLPPEHANHPSTSNTNRQQLHLITQIPEATLTPPTTEPKGRSFSFVERARRSFLVPSPTTSRSASPSPRSSKEEDGSLSVNSAASTPTTTPTRPDFLTSSEASLVGTKPHFDRIASDSRLDGLPKKSQKAFGRMFQLRANSSSPDLRTVVTGARGQAISETMPSRRVKDELSDAYRALENDFQRLVAPSARRRRTRALTIQQLSANQNGQDNHSPTILASIS